LLLAMKVQYRAVPLWKVFAGKVRKTGFFQKAGFPRNPFMSFAD